MKASELRAKAEGVIKARTPVIPEDLKYTANKAASEGCRYCNYQRSLSPEAIAQLHEDGFSVERYSSSGDYYYRISW